MRLNDVEWAYNWGWNHFLSLFDEVEEPKFTERSARIWEDRLMADASRSGRNMVPTHPVKGVIEAAHRGAGERRQEFAAALRKKRESGSKDL